MHILHSTFIFKQLFVFVTMTADSLQEQTLNSKVCQCFVTLLLNYVLIFTWLKTKLDISNMSSKTFLSNKYQKHSSYILCSLVYLCTGSAT